MKLEYQISTIISKDAKNKLSELKDEGHKINYFIDRAIKNEFKKIKKGKM